MASGAAARCSVRELIYQLFWLAPPVHLIFSRRFVFSAARARARAHQNKLITPGEKRERERGEVATKGSDGFIESKLRLAVSADVLSGGRVKNCNDR